MDEPLRPPDEITVEVHGFDSPEIGKGVTISNEQWGWQRYIIQSVDETYPTPRLTLRYDKPYLQHE